MDTPLGRQCFPGCEGPNGAAQDVGDAYYAAARATGGATYSICATSWAPLFSVLTETVVTSATVPCHYALPPPPSGYVFDAMRVNATFNRGNPNEERFPRAVDGARCTDAEGRAERAWYFDDNDSPMQILLCPAACEVVESVETGRLDIELGCQTDVILI
jgi:hypothetical protein